MIMSRSLPLIALIALSSCSAHEHTDQSAGSSAAYEGKFVRQPGSSPEDSKVYLIRNGRKQWVVNASWIVAHGHRWPADVITISAADLASIPDGQVISSTK